ncbi:3-demethylubiquinone-9 3-methyltransferase [Filimonas lacunae]|nr:3-demethylubiquinone-9 3-methyltransferase [Filimonas lacunae]
MYPCFILKGKAEEAADFYISTFGHAAVAQRMPFVVQITVHGQKMMLLNDGPDTQPTPAISFMVLSDTAEETEKYYQALAEGGKVMMELGTYPWSDKYGWVADKYGISWQLYTGTKTEQEQRISPTLMFTGDNAGKASEAIHYYTTVFPHSSIQGILKYAEGEGDSTDNVKHAQFSLNGYWVMAMDSSYNHGFGFTDAVSLVVECATQEEIDQYWNTLTADGGKEVACGWLVDKYGLRWQIIPDNIGKLFNDPEKGPRAVEKMLKMKKLIKAELENA